jgi:hypothetical protein
LSRAFAVDGALRGFEPLGVERLDRIGGGGDEPFRVVVRLEVCEYVVREPPLVAATRPTDADAQAQEVGGAEVLRDRAQAVVARETL